MDITPDMTVLRKTISTQTDLSEPIIKEALHIVQTYEHIISCLQEKEKRLMEKERNLNNTITFFMKAALFLVGVYAYTRYKNN